MTHTKMLKIRHLGLVSYSDTWKAMQSFTNERVEDTEDELWVLQHPKIFTQGQAGKAEHVLHPGDISVVQTDRGGQVTYHGPGQLVIYVLVNLRRLELSVRALVTAIEQSLLDTLALYKLQGQLKSSAPGVYINESKIASLGLRIRRGCSFHGLSLNIDMDLEPFERINPCGYAGLTMTQLQNYVSEPIIFSEVSHKLSLLLAQRLNYAEHSILLSESTL